MVTDMVSQSLTWFVLKKIADFIKKTVSESVIIDAVMTFFDFYGRKVRESGIYAWLGSSTIWDKNYKSSKVYNILGVIAKWVLNLIGRLQLFFRKIFENSLSLYLFDFVFSGKWISIDVVLAIFLGGMFVVPNGNWNNLYFVIAGIFFGVWVVMRLASGKIKNCSVKEISVAILGFVVAIFLSTAFALVLGEAVKFALFLISSIIIAYCIYTTLDTKEKLIRFIKILLLFVSLTGVYGILQRYRGVEVNLEFVDVVANNGMPGRVFSTFSNPNNFAQLLLLFMPLFIPAILSANKKREKLLLFAGLCVCFVAIAMTYSRSCWVGLALATVLFVFIYDKRLAIPMALVVIIAIPFLPDTIMNRIFTIGSMQDSSNSYRLYIWESCLEMIRDFGATGLGLGSASFKVIYPGYASPVAVSAPHSHMLYLQIIIEMGVFGAITFFAYILSLVKKTAGNMRNMSKNLKCYATACISALGGIAFVCCAEYIWFYPRVMFAFWIIPALLMSIIKQSDSDC